MCGLTQRQWQYIEFLSCGIIYRTLCGVRVTPTYLVPTSLTRIQNQRDICWTTIYTQQHFNVYLHFYECVYNINYLDELTPHQVHTFGI